MQHHSPDKAMEHDKPSKRVSYAYTRMNHFDAWLNWAQAAAIPEALYDRILFEMKQQNITNMAEVTPAKVKNIMRKMKGGACNFYESIPLIIRRLNGLAMPHFSPELEEQLRSMFRAIQAPFSRAVLQVCPDSKSFLPYSFVLHKMMQQLGMKEYLHLFPLLRNAEKLHRQDQIWKLICQELGWEFVPSAQ